MKKKGLVIGIILAAVVFIAGCNWDIQSLPSFTRQKAENELIKVEITFTDGQSLIAFVRSLGISNQGKVFVGGSSVNYFYDKSGKTLGSYNYQRVLYMKIVSENTIET